MIRSMIIDLIRDPILELIRDLIRDSVPDPIRDPIQSVPIQILSTPKYQGHFRTVQKSL